jgi:hypothetical protein
MFCTSDLTLTPFLLLAHHQHPHHTMSTDIFIIVRIVPEPAPNTSDPPILTKHLIEAYHDYDTAKACLSHKRTSIVDASEKATTFKIVTPGCFQFEGGEAHDHSLHIEKVSLKKEWTAPKDGISDGWLMVERPTPNKTRSWLWGGKGTGM